MISTQVAAWQRRTRKGDLRGIDVYRKTRPFYIPEVLMDVTPVPKRVVTESPFSGVTAADCITQSTEEGPCARNAHATYLCSYAHIYLYTPNGLYVTIREQIYF